ILAYLELITMESGLCFYAMELAPKRNLANVLAEEAPFDSGRAIYIALQMASALKEAHRVEVAHRSLDASRVYLTGDRGTEGVKIAGFGIADLSPSSDEIQDPAERAFFVEMSLASDLFALGRVLEQMVGGLKTPGTAGV